MSLRAFATAMSHSWRWMRADSLAMARTCAMSLDCTAARRSSTYSRRSLTASPRSGSGRKSDRSQAVRIAFASSRTSAFRASYRSDTIPNVNAIMNASNARRVAAMAETGDSFSSSDLDANGTPEPIPGLDRCHYHQDGGREEDPDRGCSWHHGLILRRSSRSAGPAWWRGCRAAKRQA